MSALLNYLSVGSGLLPVGAAALRYRTYDRARRGLAWFFGVSALFDAASLVTDQLGIRNLPLFHVFAVVNLVFLAWFYYRILHSRLLRGLVLLAAVLLLPSMAYWMAQGGARWQFPSQAMTWQSLLFVLLSLSYFYQLLHQSEVIAVERSPLFWVNAGVLVYFSCNLFLFMLQKQLAQYAGYWAIHSVVNITANLFYTIGLLCKPLPPS